MVGRGGGGAAPPTRFGMNHDSMNGNWEQKHTMTLEISGVRLMQVTL